MSAFSASATGPQLGMYVVVPNAPPPPTSEPAVFVAPAPSPLPSAPAMAYSAPTGRHGSFVPPLGGYVTQPFGPTDVTFEPALTYNGTAYPHFHTGIDVAAPVGTLVGASAAGTVIQVGVSNGQPVGYGNYVVIQHRNGYLTLYGHLSRVLVTLGEQVRQLELIGLVGSTGLSSGPHLHFEIRHDGEFLDPLPYLLKPLRAW